MNELLFCVQTWYINTLQSSRIFDYVKYSGASLSQTLLCSVLSALGKMIVIGIKQKQQSG